MRVDLSVDCFGAEYQAFGAYALVMLFVWPIGVPVFYCLVLYFSRHDLRRLRHLEAEAENLGHHIELWETGVVKHIVAIEMRR